MEAATTASSDATPSAPQISLHVGLMKKKRHLEAALEAALARNLVLKAAVALKKDKLKDELQPFYEGPFAMYVVFSCHNTEVNESKHVSQ